eukprot:5082425-Lingulodinium_polyedra.AAC.1
MRSDAAACLPAPTSLVHPPLTAAQVQEDPSSLPPAPPVAPPVRATIRGGTRPGGKVHAHDVSSP